MSHRSRRVALLVAAVVVALLMAEGAVRLLAPQTLSGSWLMASGRGYRLNRRSTTATHAIAGRRPVHYHLNSEGFRGGELPARGKRILVLGDSFTFGWLLDEPDTYVARLAGKAATEWSAGQVSFINAAVGGWGTADYTAFVEDRGEQLHPDVVLVFMGPNDVARAWASPTWSRQPDGTIARRPPEPERLGIRRIASLPGYSLLIEHSHAAQLVRQRIISSSMIDPNPTFDAGQLEAPLQLTETLFARLAEWCRSRGAVLLVTTSTLSEFTRDGEAQGPSTAFQQRAETVFSKLGVPYLSIARARGAAATSTESLQIPGDGHPNERGAEIIADTVWPWLRDHLQPVIVRPRP